MTGQEIPADVVAEHGLSAEEYVSIKEWLGRVPTMSELGVFSVMWSEHCSYKSSRIHLEVWTWDSSLEFSRTSALSR